MMAPNRHFEFASVPTKQWFPIEVGNEIHLLLSLIFSIAHLMFTASLICLTVWRTVGRPLWSTPAFIFESHNHCLLKMFNGTQYLPEQITDTFMLKRTTNSMARSCIDGNTCISIVNLLKKLNDTAKFAHDNTCATVSKGKATRINITASQTIAIQNLLNLDVVNRSGLLYQRFVHAWSPNLF